MRKRHTLVIELLYDYAIGKDESGKKVIIDYLNGLGQLTYQNPAYKASTHYSDKYGLAAWLPLENGSAIHLYVWEDRNPSFLSVDIVSANPIFESKIIDYTKKYFRVKNSSKLVYRGSGTPNLNWQDLASDLTRQRMTLISEPCEIPKFELIYQFLPALSLELEMSPLWALFARNRTAWMHWETSGCLLHWQDGELSLDIYACKAFDPEHAKKFTRRFFNLNWLVACQY